MFTPDEAKELPEAISSPRFGTYLSACANDTHAALRLYCWNLEVSSAFLVPLHMCEIAVRNGIVEAIERVHGPQWPWRSGFVRSLPRPKATGAYDPAANLLATASRLPATGKIVAELNFAFWEKILTKGQDQRLWVPHLRTVFPGAPTDQTPSAHRDYAHQSLFEIRKLRNRIAHHEPIFARDLMADYRRLREMIAWRRPAVAGWIDRTERVTWLISTRPGLPNQPVT